LARGIGGIGHASPEVVEKVAQQEETVVRLAFDDLVRSPEFVVDIGQNQPAHSFSATAVSAAAARVTHGHPYYRADFV
jgi:hypothetical protein